jgi:hypothetical protein
MNDERAAFITKKYTPPSRFVLIRFADFSPLEGDDYCVKGFLPRTGLAVVWGPPKSGKTFFVFDLLMHVTLGWEYRGLRVRQGPVVYVCLEGGSGFRKRREAFRLAKLKTGDDPPFFFITNPLSLAADRRALIDDIRRQVGTDIPAVVCIDTLNRSLAGSENSDADMAAYIKAADARLMTCQLPELPHGDAPLAKGNWRRRHYPACALVLALSAAISLAISGCSRVSLPRPMCSPMILAMSLSGVWLRSNSEPPSRSIRLTLSHSPAFSRMSASTLVSFLCALESAAVGLCAASHLRLSVVGWFILSRSLCDSVARHASISER